MACREFDFCTDASRRPTRIRSLDGIPEPRRSRHELAQELRPHVRARVHDENPVAVRVAQGRGRQRFQIARVVRLVARPVAGLASSLFTTAFTAWSKKSARLLGPVRWPAAQGEAKAPSP